MVSNRNNISTFVDIQWDAGITISPLLRQTNPLSRYAASTQTDFIGLHRAQRWPTPKGTPHMHQVSCRELFLANVLTNLTHLDHTWVSLENVLCFMR